MSIASILLGSLLAFLTLLAVVAVIYFAAKFVWGRRYTPTVMPQTIVDPSIKDEGPEPAPTQY